MKKSFKIAALAFLASFALGLWGCSNSSDGGSALAALGVGSGGGTAVATPGDNGGNPTDNGGNGTGGGSASQLVKYTIAIASGIENGTVKADKESAAEGETVTLTATPKSGYQFSEWQVKDSDGAVITVTGGSFVMPAKNVTAGASFTALPPNSYSITVIGGTASANGSAVTGAVAGTVITVTANAPQEGKEFDKWTSATQGVTFASETNAETTFTMPEGDVSVEATWKNFYTVTYADGVDNVQIAVPSDATRYHTGDTVTVLFTGIGSRADYEFAGWSDGSATYTSGGTKTFTMGSANVTLTAQWKFAYIGTKAPSAKKAVGDIVFTDGSTTPYADLTDAQKSSAIAVIFYAVGENETGELGAKTLGVGLKNTDGETTEKLAWARYNSSTDKAKGHSTSISAAICTPSGFGEGAASASTFTGNIDGSNNWAALKAAIAQDDTGTVGNYPAWEWVNAYPKNDSLPGDWYMPTVAELCMLYRVKSTVNAALEKAGGTKIAVSSSFYWSSSQYSSLSTSVWHVGLHNGNVSFKEKEGEDKVCCIRAFN